MKIRIALLSAVLVGSSATAFAQERVGAGRFEVNAIAGSGTVNATSSSGTEANFENRVVGAGVTYNFNSMLGIEGEVGGGLGVKRTFASLTSSVVTTDAVLDDDGNVVEDATSSVVPMTAFTHAASPRTLGYQANLVFHPMSNDHALVPYVSGGVGGLTLFQRSALQDLGFMDTATYLTGNAGAGLKWLMKSGFGIRADYRLSTVKHRATDALLFGLSGRPYNHRIATSIEYTFGK